jgi:hypothetical protein
VHLRLAAVVAALIVTAAGWVNIASASPGDDYVGPYYGDGNLPPGCIQDMSRDNPDNICYHAKVGLNALDSPKIDVAVDRPPRRGRAASSTSPTRWGSTGSATAWSFTSALTWSA